jgi:hypothetical protein
VLSVFLLIGIVCLVKFLQLVQMLKRFTARAEKFADSAEKVGDFFQKSDGSITFGRLVNNIYEVFKNRKNKE